MGRGSACLARGALRGVVDGGRAPDGKLRRIGPSCYQLGSIGADMLKLKTEAENYARRRGITLSVDWTGYGLEPEHSPEES